MSRSELRNIKHAVKKLPDHPSMEWQLIASAPFDRDLEVAVLETAEIHRLVFPCRRVLRGWVSARTAAAVDIHPTHWREWDASNSGLFAPKPRFAQRGGL